MQRLYAVSHVSQNLTNDTVAITEYAAESAQIKVSIC